MMSKPDLRSISGSCRAPRRLERQFGFAERRGEDDVDFEARRSGVAQRVTQPQPGAELAGHAGLLKLFGKTKPGTFARILICL
jgi:hypothetical protein